MEPVKTYKKLPKQKELAKVMKVTPGYVSQLLSGLRKTPKRIKELNELIEKRMKAA
jgi:predicted transcriptional regulator